MKLIEIDETGNLSDDISLDETQSRITISGIADRPGIAAGIRDVYVRPPIQAELDAAH